MIKTPEINIPIFLPYSLSLHTPVFFFKNKENIFNVNPNKNPMINYPLFSIVNYYFKFKS